MVESPPYGGFAWATAGRKMLRFAFSCYGSGKSTICDPVCPSVLDFIWFQKTWNPSLHAPSASNFVHFFRTNYQFFSYFIYSERLKENWHRRERWGRGWQSLSPQWWYRLCKDDIYHRDISIIKLCMSFSQTSDMFAPTQIGVRLPPCRILNKVRTNCCQEMSHWE